MATRIDEEPALAGQDGGRGPREAPSYLAVGAGPGARRIACLAADRASKAGLLWLGGYASDMRGTKAEHLDALARSDGLSFCRFDYSGHGESSGRFEEGTITRWTEEAEAVLDAAPGTRLILVGSSMGAWIALRLLRRLGRPAGRGRIAGLLLIAPAPDFTHRLVEPKLSHAQRIDLAERGFCTGASRDGSAPTIYTRALLEDGARNLVMDGLVETGCPVHIIQGMADAEVPFSHALDLVAALPAEGVVLTLVREGDHRLSRPQDLDRIAATVRGLVAAA